MIGRYTLHPEHRYVEEVIEGLVTLAEMADFIEKVISDPEWDPEYNGLVDFSKAHLNLTFDEVSSIAHSLKSDIRASRGHCAFVVSSSLSYGIVRVFEALSDDSLIVRIFRDRDDAVAWIGEVSTRTQFDGA